jgi:hypothetical protein
VVICFALLLCVVGIDDHLCVLMDEMRCFEFWSFYVDIDVMRVYVVRANSHVLSCLCGLFFFGAL